MTRPGTTEELFKQSGGGAPLYFSRESQVGDSIEGTVLESTPMQARDYETSVPKNWDDGTPMMQLVVTLQTHLRDRTVENDDGRRRVFLRWWGSDRQNTIDAVQRAGDSFVRDGAWMRVTFTGHGEQSNPKLNPPKVFAIEYKSPPSDTEKMFKQAAPATTSNPATATANYQPTTYQPTAQPSASAHAAPPLSNAIDDARQVQLDRKEMIGKVQKLSAAGFSKAEIEGLMPNMSREAISAILGL